MLSGIAMFAMHGRWQAVIIIVLLSSAALMLPPLNYLASGIIMLATLRMGAKEGMTVIVSGMVILTLMAGFIL